jgi:hypothetical protein
VKGAWTMKERPNLSPENVARLTEVFDRDLSRLGSWFGLNLTCANFKSVAKQCSPEWVTVAKVPVA